MRYDEYEKKVIKKTKVRRIFFRFRLPIFILSFTVIAAGGTVAGTKGVVIDQKRLSDSYTYGYKYEYQSTSFLSDVFYEFSELDEDNWDLNAPTLVGKYKMRSKGQNIVSSYYYGKDQYFEIVPKKIDVSINETSLVYGAIPTIDISSQLEFGDYLDSNYVLKYEEVTNEDYTWRIYPELDSIKIYSRDGQDVTSCYEINVETRFVKINKRLLKIKTGSDSKIYDGTSLSNEEFEIIQGSLVEGDSISLKENNSIVNVGNVNNEQSYVITNKDNKDVTKYYQIQLDTGLLEINKKPITFTSGDYEYIYDGDNHKFSLDDISYDSNDLVTDEKVTFNYVNEDKFVFVGDYENKFSASIIKDDVDVTDNYDITYKYGKTTINKRSVSLKSNSSTKTYDGDKLENNSYTITEGSLASTDKIISTSPSFTDVGEYDNVLEFNIVNKDDENESRINNYEVTYSNGLLKVEPRPITISITPLEVTYDGKGHKNEYSLSSGSLVKEDYIKENTNIERIDAGIYDKDDFKVDILSPTSTTPINNSSNYDISYIGVEEALKINKRPISFTVFNKEKLYDGKSLINTLPVDNNPYEISSGSLAENEYVSFKYLNDVSNASTVEIESEFKIYHQVGDTKDISKDLEVTNNYDISVTSGSFKINKRNITIRTIDSFKEYDRTKNLPTSLDIYEVDPLSDGLAENQNISALNVSINGDIPGVYNYIIDEDSLVISDSSNHDVTANYNVTFINTAHFTITKRDVTIKMKGDSKVYDGTPLVSNAYEATRLLSGDYVTFTTLPSVTHVNEGHINNTPSGETHIYTSEDVDVTDYYNITIDSSATIHIEPRPLTLKSSDITKTFDGVSITQNNEITITSGSLAEGDHYIVTYLESYDNYEHYVHVSDSAPNIFSIKVENGDGDDVTSDYLLTLNTGMITIKPCPIILDVYQQSVIYDGLEHNFNYHETSISDSTHDIYIVDGEMPNLYQLEATVSISNMKNVGEYNEYVTSFVITTTSLTGFNDDDFAISFRNGSQQIIARTITISTLGGSKIYDGEKFGQGLADEDLFWISDGSLVGGHTFADGYYFENIVNTGNNQEFRIYNVYIKDEFDNDVTLNYVIIYNYGKVTIYEV